jgi:hypothetical protein
MTTNDSCSVFREFKLVEKTGGQDFWDRCKMFGNELGRILPSVMWFV